MATKVFSEPSYHREQLNWNMFANMDTESRLSRLCYLVLQLDQSNTMYSLSLPGYESELSSGAEHRYAQLRALAAFDQSPNVNSQSIKGEEV